MTVHRGRFAALLLIAVFSLGGCGDDSDDQRGPIVSDPGPIHVHGLGINPADGALFIATHTGLFRAAPNESTAERVADRYQDTMGFTVVGPDRFLGSGHPDGREKAPPFLGLIRSDDAGRTWKPISLRGQADFHVLESAGDYVYGFGSDYETRRERFLVSADGGQTWHERKVPEALVSLAVDPEDPQHLIAAGKDGLYESRDGGRRWTGREGTPGLLGWRAPDRISLVTSDGAVMSSPDGRRWNRTGDVGGEPAAFEAEKDGLYVALHDGTIKRSSDGGRSWVVRSKPQESRSQPGG